MDINESYQLLWNSINRIKQLLKDSKEDPEGLYMEELKAYSDFFSNKGARCIQNALQTSQGNIFIGELDKNNHRDGIGLLIFRNGDLFLGDFREGQFHGEGFYLSNDNYLLYWGEWEHGSQQGKGTVIGVHYKSEGYYKDGKEVKNLYVKDKGHVSTNSNTEKKIGCWGYVLLFLLFVLFMKMCKFIST